MTSTVKNVFLMLMFAVIGAILYLIFFGWNTNVVDTTYQTGQSSYIGVLGYMSVAVEGSISSYYNEYVFVPTAKTGNALAVKYLGLTDKVDSINLATDFGVNTTSSAPVVSGDVKAVYTSYYNGYVNSSANYEQNKIVFIPVNHGEVREFTHYQFAVHAN